ncbi:hypothetical protein Ddye_011063 [Dipteronia dyeriana]|uniref:Uncharacterized protein n=1 Tax=Dipteronia dyeriana TaxID=168575 RepID=A0AAD9XF21_9ROSI|nr:hypothetical protein Ddye_011063 [Dipteronia dyeriana]
MQVRHICQKVHKNLEATTVWIARRFKPLIEENPDIDRQYKGQLSGLYLWNVANKSTNAKFMEEILMLQEVNIYVYNYIMKVPLKHWALHAFEN